MTTLRRSLLGLVVLAGFAGAAAGGEKTIGGLVVDAKGQPVAGAEVAVGWKCASKDNRLEPAQKIRTDRTGRFSGTVPCDEGKVAVMALDKERSTGAVRVLDPNELEKTIKLALSPLVTVNAELTLGDFEKPPKAVAIDLLVQPEGVKLLNFETGPAKLALKLPVGAYMLKLTATDAEPLESEAELDAEEPQYDLGKLVVAPKAGKAAAHTSKAPELTVTDAIGVSKTVKLSDYKGKWVLIDFWGYW